ncbi:hypothetical protein [Burkholderia sp. BCC0322]|uniref:hypothetical protein n=1 Tax=unclassified Burkholderia TaxID=2613784 RepID=UPI00158DA624|nr:hypothetical protein [Burkholderia sp. BCC0322]
MGRDADTLAEALAQAEILSVVQPTVAFRLYQAAFLDAVFAAQRCRLQFSLGFLQEADDLFFGESLFSLRFSLERTLHCHRTKRGEQVNGSRRC